ncbi:MAG: ComEC/Rec2 family competence protein [Candidatus Andersenbacteria bacterium]
MKAVLVLFASFWLVGIGGGVFFDSGLFVLIVSICAVIVASWYRWRIPVLSAAILLAALGYLWGNTAFASLSQPCALGSPFEGKIASVYRRQASQAQYIVYSSGCMALVRTSRFPEYHAGNDIRVEGKVQPVQDIPAEYEGYAHYLARQGVNATVLYPQITVLADSQTFLGRLRSKLEHQVISIFRVPEAGVIAAMLLGQRGDISEELTEQFQRSGISHILAISGLHISLFAGALLVLTYILPVSRSGRFVLVGGILWAYVVLVGAPPSAIRAGIFWSVALLALATHRLVSLPTFLVVAVVGLVSFQPAMIQDVGFQLSVSAVMGIGAMLFIVSPWQQVMGQHKTGASLITSVAVVSLGATLTTWPLVSLYFGGVPLFGIVANILVVPVVPVLVGVSAAALLMSVIFFPAASIATWIVHLVWIWVNGSSRLVANIPFGYLSFRLPLLAVVAYYVILVIVFGIAVRSQGRTMRELWQ